MVPRVGVEPTNLAVVDFESTASANSATWAFKRPRNLENPFARVHVNFTDLNFERPEPHGVFPGVSYPFFLGSYIQLSRQGRSASRSGALSVFPSTRVSLRHPLFLCPIFAPTPCPPPPNPQSSPFQPQSPII